MSDERKIVRVTMTEKQYLALAFLSEVYGGSNAPDGSGNVYVTPSGARAFSNLSACDSTREILADDGLTWVPCPALHSADESSEKDRRPRSAGLGGSRCEDCGTLHPVFAPCPAHGDDGDDK